MNHLLVATTLCNCEKYLEFSTDVVQEPDLSGNQNLPGLTQVSIIIYRKHFVLEELLVANRTRVNKFGYVFSVNRNVKNVHF